VKRGWLVPVIFGGLIAAATLAPTVANAQRFHHARFRFGVDIFIGSPRPYYYPPAYVYADPCDPYMYDPYVYRPYVVRGYPFFERPVRFGRRHGHRW